MHPVLPGPSPKPSLVVIILLLWLRFLGSSPAKLQMCRFQVTRNAVILFQGPTLPPLPSTWHEMSSALSPTGPIREQHPKILVLRTLLLGHPDAGCCAGGVYAAGSQSHLHPFPTLLDHK